MKRWTQPCKPYQKCLFRLLNALPQYNNVTVYRFEEFGNTINKRFVYNFTCFAFFRNQIYSVDQIIYTLNWVHFSTTVKTIIFFL